MKIFGRPLQSAAWALALALSGGELRAADTWQEQSPTTSPSPRSYAPLAQIATDKVLLFGGGISPVGTWSDETWVYDLATDDWTLKSPDPGTDGNPSDRVGHVLAPIGPGQVLLFGGGDGDNYFGDSWLYDLATNSWTLLHPEDNGDVPGPHIYSTMAQIGDDQVVLFGGFYASEMNDTWVYDLSENSWTEMHPELNGAIPAPRYIHGLAPLGGGQALLFGGSVCEIGADCSTNDYVDDTWVYDLAADSWTLQSPAGGIAPSARGIHGMARLSGDRVVLFGGAGFLDDTWIFDLSDNEWTLQSPADFPTGRNALGLGSIHGDQVLLFGGYGCEEQGCPGGAIEVRVGDTWLYPVDGGSSLSGLKYYDANANGEHDAGEAGIEGWPIDVAGSLGTTTLQTASDGTFELAVDPDTYTVAEQASANFAWMQTGNLVDQSNTAGVTLETDGSYTVVVDSGDYPGLYFGNLCLGPGGAPPGGAYGLGYWMSKNAAKLLGAGDLAMLTALHLREKNGSDFDPASFAELKNWLWKAKATNMAYILSAQLAALELSVFNGFVDDSLLVYAPGATSANAAGFATVADLMAEADAELALHGSVPAGDPSRAYQEELKDAIEGANKNLTFVQPSAEECPAPF